VEVQDRDSWGYSVEEVSGENVHKTSEEDEIGLGTIDETCKSNVVVHSGLVRVRL
jgi:hypothetical protein